MQWFATHSDSFNFTGHWTSQVPRNSWIKYIRKPSYGVCQGKVVFVAMTSVPAADAVLVQDGPHISADSQAQKYSRGSRWWAKHTLLPFQAGSCRSALSSTWCQVGDPGLWIAQKAIEHTMCSKVLCAAMSRNVYYHVLLQITAYLRGPAWSHSRKRHRHTTYGLAYPGHQSWQAFWSYQGPALKTVTYSAGSKRSCPLCQRCICSTSCPKTALQTLVTVGKVPYEYMCPSLRLSKHWVANLHQTGN